MGRAQVRTAVTSYLQGASLSYVGTIYAARPVIVEESAYTQDMNGRAIAQSANGSSAVLVVNIPSDKRQRQADTGRGAVNDSEIHRMALEVWFASGSGDGVKAQEDYDAVIDSIVVALRANPVAADGTVVWSMGEFRAGVEHEQTQPYTSADGMTVLINGTIRFEAWEWLAGTNV